jgi:hypothetical protein
MSTRPLSSGRSFSGSLDRFSRLSLPRLIENHQRNECRTHHDIRYDHRKRKVIHILKQPSQRGQRPQLSLRIEQTLYLKSAGFVRFLDTEFKITLLEFIFRNRREVSLDQFLSPRCIALPDEHTDFIEVAIRRPGTGGNVSLKGAVDAVIGQEFFNHLRLGRPCYGNNLQGFFVIHISFVRHDDFLPASSPARRFSPMSSA